MGSFSDEEDEIFDDDPEEERDLGYKPQKELIFNKYLPYDVDIDEEAEEYLARIKGSLSKTIAMSEIRPGTVTFMSRLSKYMKLYGMRFSKEDHVLFVKTFYELVVMPDLEFSVQLKAANMLSSLLRKKELLTRDDLELDWWPLYRTFEATFVTPFDKDKIINRPRGLRNALKSAIRRCSVYFSVSATEEILAEFRPRLCPFDSAMNLGVEYLSTFLPVNLPPEYHDRGFKLWFNEMIDMYCVCTNRIGFEPEMLFLLSRTAEHNIGYIDWSPYYPVFFTKLLQFFELPISYQGMRASLGSTVHLSSMVGILVVCLGGENSCQSHLDILFEALDSFFNPANVGKFTKNLSDFLLLLVDSFIRRLHKERYRKRQMWDWSVPEHLKLTDDDIERFVKCVLPASMLCIGSGRTLKSSVEVLQMLAFIRPDMVLPKLVEKMYQALDTLTEPHRLTSAMHCLSLCSRPMAAGARYGKPGEPVYDEGPGHILPILMKSLPGIDPNDSRKTFVTFELISFYSQLILFVDCSSAPDHYEDLTEKEHALCMETACCEDFVLEFLDRCFHFIESCSSLAECNTQAIDAGDPLAVAMSVEEQCADSALNSVCSSILSHTSSSILASALRKMQSHILGRTMETRVSGKYATSMLKGALKADPKMTLKAFVPGLIRTVKSLTENDDFLGKEHGDSELLYNLLLLAELTKVQESDAVMPYVEDLADIIDRCLMMKSREGHDLVASIAGGVIWSLIQVSPMEYRSVPFSLDEPVSKRLYIRHWADSGVPWDLDVKWNLPTAEHLELGEKLFRRFLGPIVDELQKFAKKEIFLEREPLEQRLVILEEIVCSITWGLPLWTDEEPIYTLQSCVPLNPMRVASYPKDYRFITFEGGKNVRAVLLELMHDLVERLVRSQEEETQTLSAISSIILSLFSDYGLARGAQNNHVKQWQVQRRAQEDKLGRTGRHLRPTLINRVQLQHEERCAARVPWPLMPRHRTALKDLFKLSTSRYDAVRIGAQDELLYLLRSYPSSYVFVFEEMLEIMQMDPIENHEKFKGALYLLCAKPGSLAIKQDWEVIRKLWPILVKCKPSEKPSILGLIDRTARVVQENLEMFQIHLKISPTVTQFAEQLWTCVATGQKQPSAYLSYPTAEEKKKGALALKEKGEKNEKLYMEVLTDLGNALQGVNNAQLHWRRAAVAFAMVSSALRPDVGIPMAIVRAGLQHLTNDHLLVRKHALYITCCILRLQKRARMYVDIDPVTLQVKSEPKLRAVPGVPVPAITPPEGLHPSAMGDRPDNEWLQYDASRWHDTKEKYDQPHVHKTYYGWYCWPTVMQVHAPSSAQPKANRAPGEMPETERAVFEFLADKQRWEQLMGFFCLEENKGHDKFDSRRFVFFKYLTRNFGKSMTDVFTPYLQDLAIDAQESRQRVAAEMIAGMAIGMKHWPFEEAKALQDYVVPLLTKGLSAVTPETMNDWAVGVSTVMADKDPNRYYWLLEALADNPIRDDGAFVESTRCYALQSAFTQEEWRIGKMMHRFVEYFMPHMSHPFQNIRERVASVVASLIIVDIPLKGYNNAKNPSRKAIFARLTEGLAPLLAAGICSPSASSSSLQPAEVDTNGVVGDVAMTEHSAVDGLEPMDCDDAGGECVKKEGLTTSASTSTGSDDVEKAKRLLESVSRVILGCVNRAFFTSPPEFHELLPLLANMENQDHEVDLKRCCKNCLNLLARAPVLSEDMPSILEHLGKTLNAESWKTRASGMSFLQVFCFHNMFVLRLKPEWLDTVYNFVYTGLKDARIEVRVRSSEVLGGLLHCRILTEDEQVDLRSQLLKRIRAMSKKAGRRARGLLKKDTTADDAEEDRKRIVECHSVILGLCAFVNAYPYDVPEYIPEFLMILGEHLHDPEPIPSTIKKTLSEFKRTHLDNWQEHKLKFSEDQLVMLTDLLVSPSYYA